METRNRRLAAILIALLALFTVLACDLAQIAATSSKPTVSIGSPPHGAEFPQGQEILVQANAADTTGIARVELWVDGTLAMMAQPTSPQPQFSAVMKWMASSPGSHTLMVKAINLSSATSEPAVAVVSVTAPVVVVPTVVSPTIAPTTQPTIPPAPTQIPTARPATPTTRAPTAIPTKASANQPVYGAITFSSSIDEKTAMAINAAKTFAYGIKILYASWTYSGLPGRTNFDADWYRNGQLVERSPEVVAQSSGRAYIWLVLDAGASKPLNSGNYQLNIRVGGKTVASDTFIIQASSNVSSDAITVFFTIQNGSPTGYVIDKQGTKYTPPGYLTISGFHVSAGDRIVIQTDQSRFSLLFDCSTTPGIYNPCDFVADAPSKLPAEIRKNASGTAYLNISRADNWAGTRPGFPSQRYPADPVLRIELAD